MFLQRSTTRSVAIVATAALLGAVASVGEAATATCTTVAACVFGNNTSSGIGVEGKSNSGYGVSGISTSGHGVDGTSSTSFGVAGRTTMNATSSANARAGVLGTDSSTNKNTFNSGVSGTSTFGNGVFGSSPNGYGVSGQGGGLSLSGVSGTGVIGSGKNYGVIGFSNAGTGVLAETGTSSAAALVAEGSEAIFSNNDTISLGGGTNAVGEGLDISVLGGGGTMIHTSSGYGACAQACGSYDNILIGTVRNDQGNSDVISISGNGDEILAGTLTQNGTPLSRTHTSGGQTVATFGTRSATPSLEDAGEANLVNGQGYVRLDPTFASTIDRTSKYLVFVTPQGQSNGLYVTEVTPTGFAVHENAPGHASLTFDYRIVAKPYDTKPMRLPSMKLLKDLRHNVAPLKIPTMPRPPARHSTAG